MLNRVPVEQVRTDGELAPGGDLRCKGNSWIRSSLKAAGVTRVPREVQIRLAVAKLVKKKNLCSLADMGSNQIDVLCATFRVDIQIFQA